MTFSFGPERFSGGIKVIDVSDRPDVAQVTRDGRNVAAVKIRDDRVASIVAEDLLDRRVAQLRVLSQSIPAGTRVPRGTAVDIVLVRRSIVPAEAFEGTHADLSDLTLDVIAERWLTDDQVRSEVAVAERFDDLPEATRNTIVAIAQEQEIGIDEGDPTRRSQALYETIRVAGTFAT